MLDKVAIYQFNRAHQFWSFILMSHKVESYTQGRIGGPDYSGSIPVTGIGRKDAHRKPLLPDYQAAEVVACSYSHLKSTNS